MSKCKCGKEWLSEMMPGTAEKPISGFHFQFSGDTKLSAYDEDGKPIHPFDRPEMVIVSCPECQRSQKDLLENEHGARGIWYIDGGGKVVMESTTRRSPFPFFEEGEKTPKKKKYKYVKDAPFDSRHPLANMPRKVEIKDGEC